MIPDSISKILPAEGIKFYSDVYNKSLSRTGDESLAHDVAWTMCKTRLESRDGVLVANSESFVPVQVFSFSVNPADQVIIKNHDNGDFELDAVLATTEGRRSDGQAFTEEALQDLADQINAEGSSFPDADHTTLTRLQAEHPFDVNALIAAVKREKGVFKTIKAAVRDGKLWIKAMLDRRYHNYASKMKNLSIEAAAVPGAGGKLTRPKYIGFTFTNTPQLAGAMIAS